MNSWADGPPPGPAPRRRARSATSPVLRAIRLPRARSCAELEVQLWQALPAGTTYGQMIVILAIIERYAAGQAETARQETRRALLREGTP